MGVGSFLRNAALARYVFRRCKRSNQKICVRKSDGSRWMASAPQDFGLAMVGLFTRKLSFHFVKVREWRGFLIVSPKVFWQPESGDFDIQGESRVAILPAWPQEVETAKIKARQGL